MERYMKILKGYVRNRHRPEGCIIECYIAEEVVEFCSEYLHMSTAKDKNPIYANMLYYGVIEDIWELNYT